MQITAQMVKELRERTTAGVLDCRSALEQTEGDLDQAVELLRKKGLAAAEKKADRVTREGMIGSYVHTGSKVAALVEVGCETDFVARTEEFQRLARDLAMQVVAARPDVVRPEDLDPDNVEQKKILFSKEAEAEGKPSSVIKRIVEGRMEKYYQEVCLLKQAFIKDDGLTIEDLLKENIAKFGENIVVRHLARLEIGVE